MNKLKLRVATPQSKKTTQALRVDRKNLIVYGVTTMQQGVEALGHGVMTDQITLEQTMKLVNDRQRPVIGRLGHPGMSENASGKQFYTVRDARIDSVSGNLVADLHLMEPARVSPAFGGDVIDWFMDMAEQHSGEIALSYVLAVNPVWTFADGREEPTNPFYEGEEGAERPEDALTPLPLARVEGVYYLDTVTEGAVTHTGLFQAWEGTSNEQAEQLFEALDEFRAQFGVKLSDIPRKARELAHKYVASRGYSKSNLEDAEMQLEDKQEQPAVEATDTAPDTVQIDPLDAALAQANADAEGATPNEDASAEAAPVAEAETEPAPQSADLSVELASTKAELAQYVAAFEELSQAFEQLVGTVDKLSRLSVLNQQNIGSVSKRVASLEGEPVTSAVVGGSKTKFAAPPAGIKKPTHVTERKAGMSQPAKTTPEQTSLAAFNRRSQMRANLGTTRSTTK